MGGNQSKSKSTSSVGKRPALKQLYSVDIESSFILVGNQKVSSLQYDPCQTFMVAYGINKQTDPRFSKKTLSDVTVLDAHQVCMALIEKNVLPKDHVQLFSAAKDLDVCTVEGMKESFQAAAKRTGKNGILFFHFSGHGIKVGNEWGLAPADFDYSRSTFVTGSVLNKWLNEVDCQSRYVVVSLDCCYAGGLASEVTTSDIHLRSGTYVLSACTAFETSLVIGPLGHSVYAYFLAYAIRVLEFLPGILPIHKIYQECSILCRCLTSFLVSYSSDFGLSVQAMEPVLKYFDISSLSVSPNSFLESIAPGLVEEKSVTASLVSIGRYSFVTQYLTSMDFPSGELGGLSLDWLGSMTEDGTCLKEIARRGLLRDEVLDTVVCLMMWSFASIQLVEDKQNVNNASHFLIAFLYTASALDSLYHVRLSHDHMKQSLEFYLDVVEKNEVVAEELQTLKKELYIQKEQPACVGSHGAYSCATTSQVTEEASSHPLESIQATKLSASVLYGVCPLDQSEGEVCKLPVKFNWWVPLTEEGRR